MVPEKISKYRIVGPLGQGSSGVVYQAVDETTQQTVALKIVPPQQFSSAAEKKKFLAEAQAAAQVSHPNLRQTYKVGEIDGQLYLAMEYLEGSTLQSLLVGGPVQIESALAWGADIAEGLGAAHAAGVVHGELLPEKVFLTKNGGVKLLDAGLWRLGVSAEVDLSLESSLRMAKLSSAQVASMAPEQIRGQEPDARSDVFALGRLIYHMVTGRQPFQEASPVDTMHCVLERTPAPPTEAIGQARAALNAALARAMEKDPVQRYASASELASALRVVISGESLPVPEAEQKAATRAAKRATSPLYWAIAVVLAALAAWFLYLWLAPH